MPATPKPIDPKELKDRMDRGDKLVVLDVREPPEVAMCRIEGSLHIPMSQIQSRVAELNPQSTIIVHCHHGMRSQRVGMFLIDQGFSDVSNLTGGIARWADVVDPTMARY